MASKCAAADFTSHFAYISKTFWLGCNLNIIYVKNSLNSPCLYFKAAAVMKNKFETDSKLFETVMKTKFETDSKLFET